MCQHAPDVGIYRKDVLCCRGAQLHCHWRRASNVLYMHRVNKAGARPDPAAATRPEAESHHHFVLHCPMLFWLLATTIHHARGS